LLICRVPNQIKKTKSRSATLEDEIVFITVAVFAILVGIARIPASQISALAGYRTNLAQNRKPDCKANDIFDAEAMKRN
jgi:hypothetical protein